MPKRRTAISTRIIEIGAVKLDDELETVDTFSCIIRSQIGKKLRGSVKRLTHLTNDDISTGVPFTKRSPSFANGLARARRWCSHGATATYGC